MLLTAYPKGVVITYRDKVLVLLLIIMIDIQQVLRQVSFMVHLADLKEEISKPRDSNPIGTIITVPNKW